LRPTLPQPVTATDHTFVSWSTDFSNDASADAVLDSRFKKRTAACLPFGHLPLSFSPPWTVSFTYRVTSIVVSSAFFSDFPCPFPVVSSLSLIKYKRVKPIPNFPLPTLFPALPPFLLRSSRRRGLARAPRSFRAKVRRETRSIDMIENSRGTVQRTRAGMRERR
ncbi:hypothetical protein Naga_100519g5, partial [Nannochloropsis gaditana]